jgi:hypothetical protein
MLTISSLLAKVPYANIEVHIDTLQMILLSLGLLGFAVILQVRIRRKAAIITETKE